MDKREKVMRERERKGKEFLYGLIIGIASSFVVEGMFAYWNTGEEFYLFLIFLGVLFVYLFYHQYKMLISIPDF